MQDAFDRRRFMVGMLLTGVAVATASLPAFAQAMDPAARTIQSYYASLFPAVQAARGQSIAERARRIAPAMQSVFDFSTMTRLAVGPEWSRFSGAQQQQVREAFFHFMVADYASQLNSYSGESFKVEPTTEARGGDHIVKTEVGGTQVNYLVRGNRVVDVYANGTVSELATRRAEFASILSSGGAAALIDHLRQKTQQLSGA